jgi:hypothetical protein
MNEDSDLAYTVPPVREPMLPAAMAGRRVVPQLGPVWIAAVDPTVGAVEARWAHGATVQSVWAGASTRMGVPQFIRFLSETTRSEAKWET